MYSLFEEHTELLKSGKAARPIEFGHKVLFCRTGGKFIHHYQVMPKRIDDKELLAPAIEAHKDLFGHYPELLIADKGFYQSTEQLSFLEDKIAELECEAKTGTTYFLRVLNLQLFGFPQQELFRRNGPQSGPYVVGVIAETTT